MIMLLKHTVMNVLKPENYIERINSYTELDWKSLLDMIPEIAATTDFGSVDEELDFEKTGVFRKASAHDHLSPEYIDHP